MKLLLICRTMFLTNFYRLNHQFRDLKNFLSRVRLKAIVENKKNYCSVWKGNSDIIMFVSYLYKVRYDTKFGKMIVFTGGKTHDYNVRIHGGNMTFKS